MHHHTLSTEQRFVLSLTLTGAIFLAEVIGGLWTGSLALLSEAPRLDPVSKLHNP